MTERAPLRYKNWYISRAWQTLWDISSSLSFLGMYMVFCLKLIHVAGCEGLYEEAVQFTESTNSQSTLIEQLVTESSQPQLEAAVEAGKVVAARHAVEKIQAEIEVICMTIKK